jgi:signal recognition particle GTPase
VKINTIRKKIQADEYVFTLPADTERKADDLTFHEIEQAILNGEVLERYDDTGRGESCLIVGFAGETPIHVVCGWRGDKVAIITVYVPKPPKFVDPWTREEKE